jgi:hypothetical protein
MTIRIRAAALAAGLVAFSGAGACRSSNTYDVDAPMPERVVLSVKNDHFLDMDIYALSSGLPTRIGTVPGLSTAKFALSPTLYGAGDFRIIAAPIGGNGRASSGALSLHSGQQIDFTITSNLRASHAEVREP